MVETVKKILVMDDEEMVGEIACQMLDFLGLTGVHVLDGQKAIDEYVRHMQNGDPFLAVIMDLSIPDGMGGKEAVTEILTVDKEAKVLVSSGYSSDPVMLQYRDYGFSGAIAKPFNLQDLQEILQPLL